MRYANGMPLFGHPDSSVAATAMPDLASTALQRPLRTQLREFESKLILGALQRAQGNLRRAADFLEISPQTLHYRINLLGLRASNSQRAGARADTMAP